jgi:glucose/arabinose dehydrogenase
VKADTVVAGLEVPWSIGFLPNGDMLVSERAGGIQLVRGGVATHVATVPATHASESGLLGLAIDPRFDQTHAFFIYYRVRTSNRIARWILDGERAHEEQVVLDGIPAGSLHDGGRLRFGPDGKLYAGTGDARNADLAQDPNSPAGKLLRVGEGVALSGIRNLQAFDWLDDGRFIVADHGPSGELLGRTGHDEVSVARAGDNLGWPGVWSCDTQPGIVTPILVWEKAVPPGGGAYYRGDAIPGWKNSFIVGTLASKHLHRVVLTPDGNHVDRHEVYFQDELGRLRDVVVGPDGAIYVTTSNCDGRGTCPPERDRVLRITAS